MKRSAFDVIRRGFDNALANWPLILVRIGEGFVFFGVVLLWIFAAVIPTLVSAGMSKDVDYRNPENVAQLLITLMIEHWMLLIYLFVLAFVMIGVMIAIHSFVEAGCARVYVDGERAAPAMRVFDFGRWWRGGAAGWWPVFWIYNLAWSLGCLILLVPLVLTIAALLIVEDVRGRVVFGCAGLGFTFLLFIPIAILIGIWVHKAIADCVARGLGAAEALGAARAEFRLDFGRHLAVGIVMMIIGFMAAMLVSAGGFPMSGFGNRSGDVSLALLFFAPVQLVMSFLQSVISSAVSSWTLASFVALTEEKGV